MGERRGSRGSGLRIFLVFVGAAVLTAGVWVLAANYSKDFECDTELACHGEDGNEPATIDRIVTALGFGIEPADSNRDTLPGPAGSLLVVAGMALLLAGRGPHGTRPARGRHRAGPADVA
jgi:hypothetical protein